MLILQSFCLPYFPISLCIMDDEEGFDGFSSVHGIVCFLDLIEGESLGEDFS